MRQVYVLMPLDARIAGPALGLIAGLGAGFGVFRLTSRTLPLTSVNPLLSRCRLCVACGYDVSTLPGEQDGCTVCPECGVAIRLATAALPTVQANDITR